MIKYFLYHERNPIDLNNQIPLPLNRTQGFEVDGLSMTCGDYLGAVYHFLKNRRFEVIQKAASKQMNQAVEPEYINELSVFIEKHGEFYHPARIEAVINGTKICLVLNVAISHAGKACLKHEYDFLNRLNCQFNYSFLPKVYVQGSACTPIGIELDMFLGQWFEGYKEFHISRDQADKTPKIIVWDMDQGNFFLSPIQTQNLYKQVAKILTSYYQVESFEQIYPWHHAAGDFVIKCRENDDEIDVKLITVRGYASLVNADSGDPGALLNTLLVFLLNLCIWTRLDRLDGTGDVAWADDMAVKCTLAGFFEGLSLMPPVSFLPVSLNDIFQTYLLSCTEADVFDISQTIVNAYPPLSPELPVIQKHLKQHISTLYHAIHAL